MLQRVPLRHLKTSDHIQMVMKQLPTNSHNQHGDCANYGPPLPPPKNDVCRSCAVCVCPRRPTCTHSGTCGTAEPKTTQRKRHAVSDQTNCAIVLKCPTKSSSNATTPHRATRQTGLCIQVEPHATAMPKHTANLGLWGSCPRTADVRLQ